MYRVEKWDKEENCWIIHSKHHHEMNAVANYETLATAGHKVRVIFKGLIIREA
jgi:hypothetical protein